MTLNELVKETYALGFETEGEADNAFLFSANRALRAIYSELVPDAFATFSVMAPTIAYHVNKLTVCDEQKTIEVSGISYSFRYSGSGTFTVGEGKGAVSIELKGGGAESGKLAGANKISFTGTLTLFDLTVFSSIPDSGTVPTYSPMIGHNLKARIHDLLFVTSAPRDMLGREIAYAKVSGETLYLPIDFEGEVYLRYRRAPRSITADDAKIVLDIPAAFEYLLPILTASYFLLDDDEEKSAFYMSLYKDESVRLLRSMPKVIETKDNDVTGWG